MSSQDLHLWPGCSWPIVDNCCCTHFTTSNDDYKAWPGAPGLRAGNSLGLKTEEKKVLNNSSIILQSRIYFFFQRKLDHEKMYKFFLNDNENDKQKAPPKTKLFLKANVSQEILNWHSLRHSHSADICIHFYCLSWLRQARQRKMIQSSALWLCLRLCQFKISWDT